MDLLLKFVNILLVFYLLKIYNNKNKVKAQ